MTIRRWPGLLLMCALTTMLRPGTSSAQQGGIDLAWTDCAPAGTVARSFACTSNASVVGNLIASVVPPVDVPQLNGCIAIIDLQTNQASLSPWWHLETGGCRASALTAGFDFTAGPLTCVDAWAGQASGGLNYLPGYGGPNRARIVTQCSIPGTRAMDVATEFGDYTEYYICKFILGGQRSTGEGSCGGCTDGACIILRSVTLTQAAGAPSFTVTLPSTHQYVTFQPGGALQGNCPPIEDPVPTRTLRTRAWGAVKSLYR